MAIVTKIVLLLAIAAVELHAECCGRTAIYWAADSCYPYEKDYYMQGGNEGDLLSDMMLPNRCIAKVCGDGKVHEGLYCGKGKCNIFGCNCDGGCIEGIEGAEANFRRLTGITNAAGGVSFKDPTTWHGQ